MVDDNQEHGDNKYQQQYWNLLKDARTQIIYLRDYANKYESRERNLDVFLAIATWISVGAWTASANLLILWPIVIAVAQIISVIRPYLPFGARLIAIRQFSNTLNNIALEYEKNWFLVAEGYMNNEEIHTLLMSLQSKKAEADQNCFSKVGLPKLPKLLSAAEEESDLYLKNRYF